MVRPTRSQQLDRNVEAFPTTGIEAQEPWLQWPNESDRHYSWFQAFRDLPKARRSMGAAYAVFNGVQPTGQDDPPPNTWYNVAGQWCWTKRAAQWDNHVERQKLAAMAEGTVDAWRDMGDRHAREAVALQQKALERLRNLNPNELSAAEVRQFLVQAATLERLARGATLADMAQAQRERERQDEPTRIVYVDDWRGDNKRLKRPQEGSFYSNSQGVLPTEAIERQKVKDAPSELPLQRNDGSDLPDEDKEWWKEQIGV